MSDILYHVLILIYFIIYLYDIIIGAGLVVSLPNADKYRELTRRPSQEQKGLGERTLMASQQPFHPW